MTNSEDKKRWKKEADQLKADLANRKRVVKKNEVPLSFPKQQPLVKQAVYNSDATLFHRNHLKIQTIKNNKIKNS